MSGIITNDELFLMVNVRGRSSGLSNNLWIGPRGHARCGQKDRRLGG